MYTGPAYQGNAYDRAQARKAAKPLPHCTPDDRCGSGRCLRCNDDR